MTWCESKIWRADERARGRRRCRGQRYLAPDLRCGRLARQQEPTRPGPPTGLSLRDNWVHPRSLSATARPGSLE